MKIETLLIIIVGVISILSCSAGPSGNLTLNNIPLKSSVYQFEVYYWDKTGDFLDNTEFGTVTPNTTPSFELQIPPAAAFISFFLIVPNETIPSFFYEVAYSSADEYLQNSLWLDYYEYFNNDEFIYGFGKESVKTLVSGDTLSLDYNDSPYYVLKVAADGKDIFTSLSIKTENGIIYKKSNTLEGLVEAVENTNSSYLVSSIEENGYEDIFIYIQKPQTSDTYTSIISYSSVPFIETSDEIMDLCTTNSDDLILAISDLSHELYFINPITGVITKKTRMPLQSLSDIEYSPTDNDVYILSSINHTILVYDLDTGTSSQHIYSTQSGASSLAVDDITRRVYASTADYIYMLDMDNNLNELCSQFENSVDLYNFSYDPVNKNIYSYDYWQAFKFAITDTNIEKSIVQTGMTPSTANNTRGNIAISPDGETLAFASMSGYRIKTVAASNMSFISEWNCGAYPLDAIFDNDGSHIYALLDNSTTSVVKRNETFDFSKEYKFIVPEGASNFICSRDGQKILGSFSDSDNSKTGIFFIDNN